MATPAGGKKRKRSKQEEIDEELSELQISPVHAPIGPRRQKQVSYEEDNDAEMSDNLPDQDTFIQRPNPAPKKQKQKEHPSPAQREDFKFAAVTSYDMKGIIEGYMDSSDTSECEFLWERVNQAQDIWEQKAGEDWQFTFHHSTGKPKTPSCVTRKLAGKKTNWKRGFEATHACRDCVANGRPCFARVEQKKKN